MGERLKIFLFVAFLGFVLGIVADVTATYVFPVLIKLLPSLGTVTRFLISGLAGACLTLIVISIWAYATSSEK